MVTGERSHGINTNKLNTGSATVLIRRQSREIQSSCLLASCNTSTAWLSLSAAATSYIRSSGELHLTFFSHLSIRNLTESVAILVTLVEPLRSSSSLVLRWRII